MDYKSQKREIFSDDKKEFMSGFTMVNLDILTKPKCMESLHIRDMKDNTHTYCAVTNAKQKSNKKVSNE